MMKCAHGTGPDCPTCDKEIEQYMSKGGKVEKLADFAPNEFDAVELSPAEEFSYDGENSGDNLGNEKLDQDDDEEIALFMRSKSKKDSNPRPA